MTFSQLSQLRLHVLFLMQSVNLMPHSSRMNGLLLQYLHLRSPRCMRRATLTSQTLPNLWPTSQFMC